MERLEQKKSQKVWDRVVMLAAAILNDKYKQSIDMIALTLDWNEEIGHKILADINSLNSNLYNKLNEYHTILMNIEWTAHGSPEMIELQVKLKNIHDNIKEIVSKIS